MILSKKTRKLFFVFALAFVALANFCFADYTGDVLNIVEPPSTQATDIPAYMTWVFNIGIAVGFFSILIALAVSGVFFAVSGMFMGARAKAKEWLSGAITGFLIFELLYLILTTIYPPLADFNWTAEPLKTPVLPQTASQLHGVYFYEGSGCAGDYYPVTSNVSDLNSLAKNKIGSVKMVQNASMGIYHIAITYSTQNYYGQCEYINPNQSSCKNNLLSGAPLSASVYTYNQNPSGSVTFYRNGQFNEAGGYLTLSKSNIGRIYSGDLKTLKFTGNFVGSTNLDNCTVPSDQQDCIKWNKDGTCAKDGRVCPSLAEKNISSIKIDGDYLVVLEYFKTGANSSIADFCQAYPKDSDINKYGPKQIKWDSINNSKDFFPNYVLIVPIIK